MSYVKTPLMGLGQTTAGDIPDPWTQRKAAQFNKAVATSGLGQDLAPPPPGAINWPLVIGWGAVLGITGLIFFGTTSGTHTHVRANKRRGRRSRRNSSLWSGRGSDAQVHFDTQSGEWAVSTRTSPQHGWHRRGYFTSHAAAKHALDNLKRMSPNERVDWSALAAQAREAEPERVASEARRRAASEAWGRRQAGVRSNRRGTKRRRR